MVRAACGLLLAWLIGLGIPSSARAEDPLVEKPITAEEAKHWAYQPVVRPTVPAEEREPWVKNPIDAFILATLNEFKLSPSPEASRSTLLRRLSFDLTGLPPTPEELAAFLDDRRPDAYEQQVERLLASPAYGERQAQHWLDLARYADTDGFEFDQTRPDAWRYRDWVVESFNRDLPFDEFTRLQIAGDEIDPDSPAAFVATGFNRCYPDMVDLNDQKLRRQNALNDITDTTGLVFLGLTIGCARCHDHKTDAIRQSDYYRLQAIFTPARFRDDYPIGSAAERKEFEARVAVYCSRVAAIQAELLAIELPVRQKLTPNPAGAVPDDVVAALQKRPEDRNELEVGLVHDIWSRDQRIKPRTWLAELGQDGETRRQRLMASLVALRKRPPSPLPLARGIDEAGTPPEPTFLLIRGEHTRQGHRVEPDVPQALRQVRFRPQPTQRSSGRRRALAHWLTDPRNPLTARVYVNRLWQMHFGRGIVATTSDFGTGGVAPTHPELLDWLASELVRQGWSTKAIHRLIVTSATYRQASTHRPAGLAADPENTLHWRQNRRRLDGEAIRDALLSVSGQLVLRQGGVPIFPELPAELTKLSSKGSVWPVSALGTDRNRRSLYVFVRRNLRYPFFEVFDRPDTNSSCPQRPTSTIAPQALTLFNGKLSQEAATGLVRRLQGLSLDQKITTAFRLTNGRDPSPSERSLALEFLRPADEDRLRDLALALLNANEFVYVD